jgi:malate dehydrogenase (quinone)
MVFSTDFNQLKEWMLSLWKVESETDRVAATSMTIGTDVNFGELTRNIFTYLANLEGVTMHFNCEVQKLKQREDKLWRIKITDLATGIKRKAYTKSYL